MDVRKIFVSYARKDDFVADAETVNARGWVSTLVFQLQQRVRSQVPDDVEFIIDQQLNGHEQLDAQIRRAISESSIFMMIGSTSFLHSDWCMNRELPRFLASVSGGRIFVVEKTPYDRDKIPGPASGQLGHVFWELDAVNHVWETFGDPPPVAVRDRRYQARLNALSQQIAAVLQEARPDPAQQPQVAHLDVAVEGPAVYLAEVSEDLYAKRDTVYRYLLQQKVAVFSPKGFPSDLTEYRDRLKAVLRRKGIIFAQLLSAHPGRRIDPEEPASTVARVQDEVARGQRVPIIQWCDYAVEPEDTEDASHRQLLESCTVQKGSLEAFKALLVDRAQEPPPRVVVSRDAGVDETVASDMVEIMRKNSFSAELVSVHEPVESLKPKLRTCEAIFYVHGAVPEDDIHGFHDRCSDVLLVRPGSPPMDVVLLAPPPPKPPAENKRRWYEKARKINCVPPDDPARDPAAAVPVTVDKEELERKLELYLNTHLDTLPRRAD